MQRNSINRSRANLPDSYDKPDKLRAYLHLFILLFKLWNNLYDLCYYKETIEINLRGLLRLLYTIVLFWIVYLGLNPLR